MDLLVCLCYFGWCGLVATSTNRPVESEVFLMGLPIVGGLIDSVIGIVTGTVLGVAPQLAAPLRSLGIPCLNPEAHRAS